MGKKRLLFAIAGAGTGNFSRVMAILEELDEEAFEVALLAQSRASQRARRQFAVFPLLDVTYGTGDFTIGQVVRQNSAFPLRYWNNRKLAGRALDEFRPDLLVVDSDFHSLPEARRRGIPILSINSSPATLAIFRRMPHSAASLLFAYCIERIDRRMQRQADRILCPVLDDVDTGVANAHLLPPIVRRQFRTGVAIDSGDTTFDVGVMMGGSGLGTSEIDLSRIRHSMVVVGASAARCPPHAVRLPFTEQPAADLRRCRVLVIQGGFNSVSEAIALEKPTVIVPIPNHVEQLVNAWWAEQLGFGVTARGFEVGEAVTRLLAAGRTASRPPSLQCNGAAEAAQWIREMVRG